LLSIFIRLGYNSAVPVGELLTSYPASPCGSMRRIDLIFRLAEIRISGKLLKSILCLALTLSPLALTALNSNQYAYVAVADSGQVYGYLLNATNGNLTPLEGSPFPNPNYAGLSSIATGAAGRFLYATSQYAPSNEKSLASALIDRAASSVPYRAHPLALVPRHRQSPSTLLADSLSSLTFKQTMYPPSRSIRAPARCYRSPPIQRGAIQTRLR
jgi:hypothetical protein